MHAVLLYWCLRRYFEGFLFYFSFRKLNRTRQLPQQPIFVICRIRAQTRCNLSVRTFLSSWKMATWAFVVRSHPLSLPWLPWLSIPFFRLHDSCVLHIMVTEITRCQIHRRWLLRNDGYLTSALSFFQRVDTWILWFIAWKRTKLIFKGHFKRFYNVAFILVLSEHWNRLTEVY